jgi:hypothetical protein
VVVSSAPFAGGRMIQPPKFQGEFFLSLLQPDAGHLCALALCLSFEQLHCESGLIDLRNADKVFGMQLCKPSKFSFSVCQLTLGGLHLITERLISITLLKAQAPGLATKAEHFSGWFLCGRRACFRLALSAATPLEVRK